MEVSDSYELRAQTLIAAVQNDFGFDISEIESVLQGYSNQVYRANKDNEDIYIRIREEKDVYSAEEKLYALLKEQGIPVPEVLGVNENPESIGEPTMILKGVKGTPLGELDLAEAQKDELYLKAGQLLARIHQIKLPGFGKIRLEGDQLKGVAESWGENWRSFRWVREDLKLVKQHQLLLPEEQAVVEEIYQEIQEMPLEQGYLLHNDFHGAHIFIQESEISGVIDWTSAIIGDPRYDIAMSMMFLSPQHQQSFKQGYGDLASDPLVLKYLLIIAARKIGFRHSNGSKEGTEKAVEVFRQTRALLVG